MPKSDAVAMRRRHGLVPMEKSMPLLNKLAAPIAGLALMLITAVPVAAVTPPEITRISDQNFTTSTHFADSPCGPAGTDIATGSFHLVVIDAGDAVHVNYTESVRFISVADD